MDLQRKAASQFRYVAVVKTSKVWTVDHCRPWICKKKSKNPDTGEMNAFYLHDLGTSHIMVHLPFLSQGNWIASKGPSEDDFGRASPGVWIPGWQCRLNLISGLSCGLSWGFLGFLRSSCHAQLPGNWRLAGRSLDHGEFLKSTMVYYDIVSIVYMIIDLLYLYITCFVLPGIVWEGVQVGTTFFRHCFPILKNAKMVQAGVNQENSSA